MVRRRVRTPQKVAGTVSRNGELLANSRAHGQLQQEDQYFASPKRKDCKIDNVGLGGQPEELPLDLKSNHAQNIKGERGGIAGRTIGVPLATRSQTRTIENFFKAKTAAKSAKLKATDEEKTYNLTTLPRAAHSPTSLLTELVSHGHAAYRPAGHDDEHNDDGDVHGACGLMPPEYLFDMSEDTNDTDHTELSDETGSGSGVGIGLEGIGAGGGGGTAALGIDFTSHRSSSLRDSHSSTRSCSSTATTTDNIFLQEPVLSLNVEWSPDQAAASIKINKTLEIEPIFSSPPRLTHAFNQIVSLQGSPATLRESFGFESKAAAGGQRDSFGFESRAAAMQPYPLPADNDNSSCDSGIAFASSLDTSASASPMALHHSTAATRRRKPATPHRILCPSPVKAASRVVSPASLVAELLAASSGRRSGAGSVKEQLSPRKSHRHLTSTVANHAGVTKSRRKLLQPKEQATRAAPTTTPTKKAIRAKDSAHARDGVEPLIKLEIVPKAEDAVVVISDDSEHELDEPGRQQHDQGLENLAGAHMVFHAPAKHPTAQQTVANHYNNSHNNNLLHATKTKGKSQAKAKQTASAQPLAATNGNRELTDFFPVRRSVRKTKSAVKEEMMRSLEQAVLEERADGLKIEHFPDKGRGVVAERRFQRGEFVIEYVGDLISVSEAADRERRYALDENAGCYMYYFKHKNQQHCIDATADTGKLGRLVNHSRNGNLVTKVVVVKQRPHLILIAKDHIEAGEELTYDYGDRSKESLLHHPWLAF